MKTFPFFFIKLFTIIISFLIFSFICNGPIFKIEAFFMSNTFIRNARLKLKKYQAKDKQHPEGELLLYENYLLSLSTLSSKQL